MQGRQETQVEHFVAYMGLEIWHDDDGTWGRATVRPEMWAPSTRRPRLGLLFALADIVGGSPATGVLTPTIDLRFQLLSAAPSEGAIVLQARPLKIGRRLWTGEVWLRAAGRDEPFARCEFSFINQTLAGGSGEGFGGRRPRDSIWPLPAASFDELFQMRLLDDGCVEMDAHDAVRNGVVGTIQGGAQATMAEVAAERVLAGRGSFMVYDLHLRYLNALKAGPAVARPSLVSEDELRPVVTVSITDAGFGDRVVSTAIAVCRPDPDSDA